MSFISFHFNQHFSPLAYIQRYIVGVLLLWATATAAHVVVVFFAFLHEIYCDVRVTALLHYRRIYNLCASMGKSVSHISTVDNDALIITCKLIHSDTTHKGD